MDEEKNVFSEEENRFADLSLEELLASAKDDIADMDPSEAPSLDEPVFLPKEEPTPVQKQRMPVGLRVLLYVCAVLFASAVLAVGAWICAEDVLALSKPDREVTFTVEQNMTINQLSHSLKDAGLIEYPWLFRLYCMFSHAERKIDAGTYQLNNLYDYHALINGMIASSGDRSTVTVTIPEGFECADIFALLEENGVCSVQTLEDTAANSTFDYDFLRDIPYGEKNRLEGYLFPDTYEFFLNDDPERVLSKFLSNFERKLTPELLAQMDILNGELADRMDDNGFTPEEIENSALTLHDVMIVASLIEKESGKTSESASIASVIYNRLCSKIYPCLQIDATIQYALAERKEILNNTDKAVISPYNTYTNAGLPVGPIANPGINSIRAALYPADTDYYFYVLGENGTHVFSETYYEHQNSLAESTEAQNEQA